MLTGLNHLTLSCRNLDVSWHFYVTLLGFQPKVRWARGAYLSLGELWLCLSQGESIPAGDYSHIALGVAPDQFDACVNRLRQAGVREWQSNRSEGHSLYLLDPDDHQLEIHVGTLASRLAALSERPYPGLVWY